VLNIVELLSLRGLLLSARIKLVRHQDKRFDVHELIRDGYFEVYQSFQSKPVFDCDFIVSFVGMENAKARLIGVYRVVSRVPASQSPISPDFTRRDLVNDHGFFYTLDPVPGFEDLAGRVVIDWGRAALAWHQWLAEKEVVEVLPVGYVREFPGYLDFVLSFPELSAIIGKPDANREWHRMLGAIAGVYLITDMRTGKQYVGSASGEAGVLGRWAQYVRTGHGGNVVLQQVLAANPGAEKHFQFTLLRTLPQTLTRAEVIAYEVLYKRKLGSRVFGLNSN
jgi:hypothetical protein